MSFRFRALLLFAVIVSASLSSAVTTRLVFGSPATAATAKVTNAQLTSLLEHVAIDDAGNVTITGSNITIKSQAAASVSGSSVTIKSQTTSTLSSSGTNTITGAVVKIN